MKNGNIWILNEALDNTLSPISTEIMSKGRELADALEKELVVIELGYENDEIVKEIGYYGADKVIQVNDKLLILLAM